MTLIPSDSSFERDNRGPEEVPDAWKSHNPFPNIKWNACYTGLNTRHRAHRIFAVSVSHADVYLDFAKAHIVKELNKLSRGVFPHVHARSKFIEVLGYIVRARETVGSSADICSAAGHGTGYVLQLLEGVVGVNVLHHLIAVRYRDRPRGNIDALSIRDDQLHIWRNLNVLGGLLRDLYGVRLFHQPAYMES